MVIRVTVSSKTPSRSPGPAADTARPDVVRELVVRLGSVEDQLDLVASQAKVSVDPTMGEHLGELAERVTKLRAGVEALRVGL